MFEVKASMWYFSLTPRLIPSWKYFQTTFHGKFGDDKTPTKLVLELSRIKMDPKEKMKDFNQRFLTLENKISLTSRPTNDVIVELYMETLPPSMAMFVKSDEKPRLTKSFEEVIKVKGYVECAREN